MAPSTDVEELDWIPSSWAYHHGHLGGKLVDGGSVCVFIPLPILSKTLEKLKPHSLKK